MPSRAMTAVAANLGMKSNYKRSNCFEMNINYGDKSVTHVNNSIADWQLSLCSMSGQGPFVGCTKTHIVFGNALICTHMN